MTRPDNLYRKIEGEGPWLYPPRKPKPALGVKWLVIAAIGFAVAALIGTVAIPAPPPMQSGPGFDVCMNVRC